MDFKIISLGWGIQSFTLAAMAALGELDPVNAAVHADTTHERSDTYEFAARWTPWLEARGVRVVTVSDTSAAGAVAQPGAKKNLYAPFYTSDGGRLFRQCTERWKIRPIRRWVRKQTRGQVVQMMGISLDEIERIKPSAVAYISNVYPLIDKRMTRMDCETWLREKGLEIPPKSACVFCPFHSAAACRALRFTRKCAAWAGTPGYRTCRRTTAACIGRCGTGTNTATCTS